MIAAYFQKPLMQWNLLDFVVLWIAIAVVLLAIGRLRR